MNTILDALYNLLSFVTEDAVANGYIKLPKHLHKTLNETCIELGNYLDEQNMLDKEYSDE